MEIDEEIKKKIYDIHLVVEDIKKFPQTYSTILQCKITNSTIGTILRKKLNKLVKDGFVCKTTIPGTRFGKVLFYHEDKKYYILCKSDRLYGSKTYCFFNYNKRGRYYIQVENYWELINDVWIPKKDEDREREFFQGDILKFI